MFKNLEKQFNATVNNLYGEFSLKTAPESQPFIEIKPNNPTAEDALTDTRNQTGVSGRNDISRETRFMQSPDGKAVFNLEKVLQTGNTISETRTLAPGWPLIGRNHRSAKVQADSVLIDTEGTKSPGSPLSVGYGGRLQHETKTNVLSSVAHTISGAQVLTTVLSATGLGNLLGASNLVSFGSLGIDDRPELDIAGRWYVTMLAQHNLFQTPVQRIASALTSDIANVYGGTFQRVENSIKNFISNKLFGAQSQLPHFSSGDLPSFLQAGIQQHSILAKGVQSVFSDAVSAFRNQVVQTANTALTNMITNSPLKGMFTTLFSSALNLNPLAYNNDFPQQYYVNGKNEGDNVIYLFGAKGNLNQKPYALGSLRHFSNIIPSPTTGQSVSYVSLSGGLSGTDTYGQTARSNISTKLTHPDQSLESRYNQNLIFLAIQNDINARKLDYAGEILQASNIGIVGGLDSSITFETDIEFRQKNQSLPARRYFVEADSGAMGMPGYQHDQLNMQIASDTPDESIKDTVDVRFFNIGTNKTIRFRALISNLRESSTPTYNDIVYLGRIEKNITYSSVVRDVSFDLDIMALTADELVPIWRNISYLKGMTFPNFYDSDGHIIPPLIRLTIGNLYQAVPGFIKSLSMDIADTWEIAEGHQVPHGAKFSIAFQIIEEKRRFSDSLFHAYPTSTSSPIANVSQLITSGSSTASNAIDRQLSLVSSPNSGPPNPILSPIT